MGEGAHAAAGAFPIPLPARSRHTAWTKVAGNAGTAAEERARVSLFSPASVPQCMSAREPPLHACKTMHGGTAFDAYAIR